LKARIKFSWGRNETNLTTRAIQNCYTLFRKSDQPEMLSDISFLP